MHDVRNYSDHVNFLLNKVDLGFSSNPKNITDSKVVSMGSQSREFKSIRLLLTLLLLLAF